MDWERASPGARASNKSTSSSNNSNISNSRSEAITVVVAGDKKNKCNKPARANDLSNNNNNPTTTSSTITTTATTTTTGQQLVSRKNKPIPPPLDLSIGATNLSLHHHHHNHHHQQHHQNQSSTTHHHSNLHPPSSGSTTTSHSRNSPTQSQIQAHQQQQQQQQNQPWYLQHQQQQQQQSPSGYLGSPKFTQSEKSLPLRKRWHSWSTVPGMNGQEDSLLPLYSDLPTSPLAIKSEPQQQQQQQQHQESQSSTGGGDSSQNPLTSHHHGGGAYHFTSATTAAAAMTTNSYRYPYGSIMNGCGGGSNNGNSLGLGLSIQTPSPFFTPNEPSPKFMNSPVFSYSTPDTSLYQGPFSPMRSCLYPPPSSPFTNLSLNTPGGPNSNSSGGGGSVGSQMINMINMIPSTLLSPAPSQASTNSLSYEDLHEKSLNFYSPVWSIFMSGTKVRFLHSRHLSSTDWYSVDFLAQNESVLNLKGEYAPHGLEVRKFVKTSSSKERIQVTFCPVGDPDHPTIEVDCEPGHPFMVDKKGWCSVKPDVFQELFGTQCLPLDCGDVCLNMSRLGQQNVPVQLNLHVTSQQHQQQQQHQQTTLPSISAATYSLHLNGNNVGHNNNNNNSSSSLSLNLNLSVSPNLSQSMGGNGGHSTGHNTDGTLSTVKIEPGLVTTEEKIIPISVLPASQTMQSLQQLQQSSSSHATSSGAPAAKMFAIPSSVPSSSSSGLGMLPAPSIPVPSPAKRAKENQQSSSEQKGRRPMNAFLLFAKDKRPELIQQYPGKDNRSISVLLGEAWANLEPPEKARYSSNARARAEEQKRIHPDCWKRKRSQSTSS